MKNASSRACCNYLAKTKKTSQKLRAAIGNIPAAVITRSNSYLSSGAAVYNARTRINDYVTSTSCSSDIAKGLRPHVYYLNKIGFCVLHDVSIVLKTLADLMIDEEGDYSGTLSVVIPLVLAAREDMSSIIDNALYNDRSENKIINTRNVGAWKEQMLELWDTYLLSFLNDELFLAATMLYPRNGCGQNLSNYAVAKKAQRALQNL